MSYPSFSVGEVLTAADMNAVGLWLVKSQSLSGTETTVTSCFNTNFRAYRVVFSNLTFSAIDLMTLRLVSGNTPNQTSNYYSSRLEIRNSDGVVTGAGVAGASYWAPGTTGFTTASGGTIDIYNPFQTVATAFTSNGVDTRTDGAAARYGGGFFNGTTSFDGLWISNLAGNRTMGGTVSVYGYKN